MRGGRGRLTVKEVSSFFLPSIGGREMERGVRLDGVWVWVLVVLVCWTPFDSRGVRDGGPRRVWGRSCGSPTGGSGDWLGSRAASGR